MGLALFLQGLMSERLSLYGGRVQEFYCYLSSSSVTETNLPVRTRSHLVVGS